MATVANLDLSELIVSVAGAVSQANVILNTEAVAPMTVTQFEVDATFVGMLTTETVERRDDRFSLLPQGGGEYRVAPIGRLLARPARVALWQPRFNELLLPSSQTQSSRLSIRAVISPVAATSS